MRIAQLFVAFTAATLMLAGCANQKEPAEKALVKAESSLSELRADGEKYAAEQLKTADESLARLKGSMEKQDYKAVLVGVPSMTSDLNTLKVAVATKKADMEATMAAAQAEWTELSASVPQMVDAIQSRVDTLTKSRKLPKDLDQATFDAAKSTFDSAKADWTEATAQFTAGNTADAVRKARSARAKGAEVLRRLGMNS